MTSTLINLNPLVIDLSHYNVIEKDLEDARAWGVQGVIHKATEGATYRDRKYKARRWLSQQSGLLFGAYHFLRPGDIAGQVEHFVRSAEPDKDTLMALDHEDERVPVTEVKLFLELLAQKLGRKPVLYSGHVLKGQLGLTLDAFLGSHRLWHAQYGPRPIVQRSWSRPWLWQFTGDGIGPPPHNVPGISIPGNKGIDINHFDGTPEQLGASWS
jgi:lysozyme